MNCECNVFCFKFEERLFSRGIPQMSAENLKQRSFAKPSKRCDYSLVFDEELPITLLRYVVESGDAKRERRMMMRKDRRS